MLSIFEVLDEAEAEEPLSPPPENAAIGIDAQLVSVWMRSNPQKAESFIQRVTVTLPDGTVHDTGARIEGNLTQHQRTRLLIGVRAIRFGGMGTYLFNIHLERNGKLGKAVDSVPINFRGREADPSST